MPVQPGSASGTWGFSATRDDEDRGRYLHRCATNPCCTLYCGQGCPLERLGFWRTSVNTIESLFVTRLQEDGIHWALTLPTHASRFLADIEHLFGPRDPLFSVVGIEIDATPDASPCLWYPNSGIAPDDPTKRPRHVVIRLTSSALTDPARARWQLAHECLHLLDPWCERVDGRPTNWLEEGLAAWYQNSRVPEARCREGLYKLAEDLVMPQMDKLPDAIKSIRRELSLRISEISSGVLQSYCPRVCSHYA